MPRKHNADGSPRRKKTFGGANVDRFSPPPSAAIPKAINCVLSFEEALKLHLSLGQLLGHLNGYDRSTKAGRRSAVNLCVYTERKRIVVVESKIGGKAQATGAPDDAQPTT
jgi:hypothetical protein